MLWVYVLRGQILNNILEGMDWAGTAAFKKIESAGILLLDGVVDAKAMRGVAPFEADKWCDYVMQLELEGMKQMVRMMDKSPEDFPKGFVKAMAKVMDDIGELKTIRRRLQALESRK